MSMRFAGVSVLGSAAVLAAAASAATAAPVRIAYETSGHQEQTRVVNANGSGRKLLGTGQQPAVSPNGQMVAASPVGSHGAALRIYSTVGKPTQVCLNLSQAVATAMAWSPDSRYLAVDLEDTTASSTASNAGAGGVAIVDTTTRTVKLIAKGFVWGASFDPAPNAGDRLAYGLSGAHKLNSRTEIYASNADGTDQTQITHGGRSLNPVWGPKTIAFDRQRFRGDNAPAYNIWQMNGDGSNPGQITHVRVGPLLDGLVPVAWSASGRRMVAEFVGEDTNEGYTVSVVSRTAKLIKVAHHDSVEANGISRNGRTVLVTLDAGENPTAVGQIATIPFSGGRPRVFARHAGFGSWNG
jgi:Tol biopolymer transport system component